MLNITGDASITGDLDVSGAITGGTIPIENLSDVEDQSFVNLLENGDFKLWPAGASSAPGGWEDLDSPVISRDTVVTKIDGVSCKLTATSVDSRIFQSISNPEHYKGRTVTLGCWVYSTTPGDVKIGVIDNGGSIYTYGSGGDVWEWLTITRDVVSNANVLYWRLYPDAVGGTSDVYISGAMLVEGSICPAFSPKPLTESPTYGEMYIYNNSNATVIETADTPIALRQISEGLNSGLIFHAGSTDNILGFSGTPAASPTTVSSFGHGLSTGDIITIRGTTNYNGIFEVTYVGVNSFSIDINFVADDGASDWDQGASLTVQPGAEGVYTSTWQMTTAPAGACRVIFKANINTTPQNKSSAARELAINDEDNNSSTCLLELSVGDILWLSAQSDATTDITNAYGNINIERIR